jgi:hypothetical protein
MSEEIKKVHLELRRGSRGLIVSVKADKAIEEFFAAWANSRTRPLTDYSRNWRPIGDRELSVWNTPEVAMPADISLYSIGGGLVVERYEADRDRRTAIVNLSFLRLVGISDGVEFTVAEVMDKDGVHRAFQGITKGLDTFYRQYLAPVKYTLELIAKEG